MGSFARGGGIVNTPFFQPLPAGSRLVYYSVVLLRFAFFAVFISALSEIADTGLSLSYLLLAALIGVLGGSRLAFSRLSWTGLALGTGAFLAILYGFSALLNWMPITSAISTLHIYLWSQNTEAYFYVLLVAALSCWAYWRIRGAATAEAILIISLVVYLLSGHRNFHFDTPQLLNTLAWEFRINQLSMLIATGTAVTFFLILYLYSASHPASPSPHTKASTPTPLKGRTVLWQLVATTSLILVFAVLITKSVYSHYRELAATRAANGVGQSATEGDTPLGFHSALGGTNQPAALVRLDGDYGENPFLPMLYLRESALSEFNGREMVIAEKSFDRDVTRSGPDEVFLGEEDTNLLSRTPLYQSIYLLSDHSTAFAVDYPLSITPLKNPDPARFRRAFKAYSMAPAFSLQQTEIQGKALGDDRWDAATKAHYLKLHSDKRYQEYAKEHTDGIVDPLDQAFALTALLSKNAIYTLTPGHDVEPNGDPVAPFLFGDMRGYCVHFAHSLTYLFRSLGIPARVATGYLTDLSQSKDGHILLRMSDRHAWAEIYIQDLGWIPFDPKPEQVESHAETPVDMQLLEELMGLVGPDETILPSEIAKDEANIEIPARIPLPDISDLLLIMLAGIALLAATKAYLRYGWLLSRQPEKRMKSLYVSCMSLLYDLGYRRAEGETREEFERRISRELGQDLMLGTAILHGYTYGGLTPAAEAVTDVSVRVRAYARSIKPRARMFAALNPGATLYALFRGKW